MKKIKNLPLLITLVLVILNLTSCASASIQKSSALNSGEIKLKDFKYAVIYHSETASFIELDLESLLEEAGLKVIGEKEAVKYSKGKVLAARYKENYTYDGYGSLAGSSIIITLEDYSTSKTLITVQGTQTYSEREMAWNKISEKLKIEFGLINPKVK